MPISFVALAALTACAGPATAGSIVLQGKIVDRENIILEGLKDGGAPLPDGYDWIAQRMIQIRAFHDDEEIAVASPREDRSFSIEAPGKVTRLVLQVGSGGLYLEFRGPWRRNATVDLDLSRVDYFTIEGKVSVKEGNATHRAQVTALGENGEQLTTAVVRRNGAYLIRCNRTVQAVRATILGKPFEKEGPFSRDVDLDFPK